jgi:hypothetical protein
MYWCCRTIERQLCYICDTLLTATVCLGGISTATTTVLQYTGHIDHWKAVVIPSVLTFVAILGCVLRCACRAQTQTNQTSSTVIIHQHVSDPPTVQSTPPEIHEAVAIPISHIEMTIQPSIPLRNEDMVAKIHQEWRNFQESV